MTFLDLDLNTKNLIRGLAEFACYSLYGDYTALEMELKAHQRFGLNRWCCCQLSGQQRHTSNISEVELHHHLKRKKRRNLKTQKLRWRVNGTRTNEKELDPFFKLPVIWWPSSSCIIGSNTLERIEESVVSLIFGPTTQRPQPFVSDCDHHSRSIIIDSFASTTPLRLPQAASFFWTNQDDKGHSSSP